MTSVAQSLGALHSHSWERSAWTAVRTALGALGLMARGAGLGLIGLAVVMCVTAGLIGIHELSSAGLPSVLPPHIRFH
jgi:hypothetical protein